MLVTAEAAAFIMRPLSLARAGDRRQLRGEGIRRSGSGENIGAAAAARGDANRESRRLRRKMFGEEMVTGRWLAAAW